MRRLKVGVWLVDNSVPNLGGVFGYYSELIDAISKTKFSNADICFLGDHSLAITDIGYYKYYSIRRWQKIKRKLLQYLKLFDNNLLSLRLIRDIRQNISKKQNEALLEICDIIYYPLQMCIYEDFPFIYTLMDLGHLNSYPFPEVSYNGIFENRKSHFNTIPFKALMILCESEAGEQEAIHYLRLREERLRVFPLFSSQVISEKIVAEKPELINLDWIFIHYPAQFWAHKNHYNLICAFELVLNKFPDLKLILTGSDHGNKEYIRKTIKENHLNDSVIDLGFVSIPELKWIYTHSKGLIMPTLMGPTNMPPIEALALECPVAISDFPGHREQLGDNAIYFNPLNVADIQHAIENILENNCKRPASVYSTIQANMILLDKYFDEVRTIRRTWA